MLKIKTSKRAAQVLKRVPPKHGRQLIARIEELARKTDAPDVRPVSGHPPYLRVTAGEYRIIYHIEGDTLYVEIIGKRNDDEVYRQLRRLD